MLTDAALKHLRPKEKSYKVTDRDGMYALVSTKGSISFRLDYRMASAVRMSAETLSLRPIDVF